MPQSQDRASAAPAEQPAPKPAPRCTWCFGEGERWINGELAECPQCGGNGMARPPLSA